MNLDRYLKRIGLDHRPPATLEGLRMVHRAHLLAIPYENIDVQLGRPVTTAIAPIYDKIIERGRGGWCYEMNGSLGWALKELGFDVIRATGAVVRALKGEAAVGNHLVLRVELPEGLYLADVGFGDGPRDPIPLKVGAFVSEGFHFGLSRVDDAWWRFANDPRGSAPSFDFNLAPADEAVLAAKCEFLQTSPMSPFVQNLVVQRHMSNGLAILRGRTLRELTPTETRERVFEDVTDLMTTLTTVFGLDVPEVAGLWSKIVTRHDEVMAQKKAAAPA
ncbi:MAG: arylamine N-acetyltransferase [Alphaproteobacteria bacterium]|nr:arylamine N-acetyltransferase [Alphaproteobacteria bacterium]MBL6936423.1 arylamine N-acetyltransferase [Alphaproteobacteria bacterium]MBL7098526.1 arylamine N-acetyltransferase [Alphaproteobacteria bacterium]